MTYRLAAHVCLLFVVWALFQAMGAPALAGELFVAAAAIAVLLNVWFTWADYAYVVRVVEDNADLRRQLEQRDEIQRRRREIVGWGGEEEHYVADSINDQVIERFWSRVDRDGSCWEWTRGKNSKGYGYFCVNGKDVRVHRFAYELLVGPIPDGLVLDHLCRNRACVNPEHLEPVTHLANVMRGKGWRINARKTHCPSGHEYTAENTYIHNGSRRCRECNRLWKQKAVAAKSPGAPTDEPRPLPYVAFDDIPDSHRCEIDIEPDPDLDVVLVVDA